MPIKGDIIRDSRGLTVKFVVNELMINNTPHTNFWTFCLINDLVEKAPDDDNRFRAMIDNVEFQWSEKKEWNDIVIEMFEEKLHINIL